MSRSWLVCAFAQLWLAGCGNDLGYGPGELRPDSGLDNTPAVGGLPCDIGTFLAEHCQGCHGKELVNGAPIHLVTYADLLTKNAAGLTAAQRAFDRIRNTKSPMPPLPASSATAAEISMFETWITAGTPPGECTAPKGPFDGPLVCTSGTHWTRGDHESPLMHPGGACITCHTSRDEGPDLKIGGTVYPTGHEPNDCNGVSPATGATVEVTDVNGKVTLLPVNAAGNFLTEAPIAFPIHVAVVANGKRRSMGGSPPTGNCNGCHTQDGANMAPGRIVLP